MLFLVLALLSILLLLWQWLAGREFPLHRKVSATGFNPPITLLKPLKGCDAYTANCLRSWLVQQYPAAVQVLFGVASKEDPVCAVVEELLKQFPDADARLIICEQLKGTNAKVAKLATLLPLARHEFILVSDADVQVPTDFLAQAVQPLQDPKVGLVNCFYELASPVTPAMNWEAIAINVDFWSQVLQSRMLKPLDFALGAVMLVRRTALGQVGGFVLLRDYLADDYELGHRIAGIGSRIEVSPLVVQCWSEPMDWEEVWRHQLRWARTIRVCQPVAYFFSILGNPTLWPWLWVLVARSEFALVLALCSLLLRVSTARDLYKRLAGKPPGMDILCLVPLKDLLQVGLWVCAFTGNTVEWRGQRMKLRRDGTLVLEQ